MQLTSNALLRVMQRSEAVIRSGLLWLVAHVYLRKPDLYELLEIKVLSLATLRRTIFNELCFRLQLERSYAITAINLEATNGCNLTCVMCPVNTTMTRPKGFMDFELFKQIVDDNPQVEMFLTFQWGEPLMHERIFEMIAYAQRHGAKVCMTTNGTYLSERICEKILASGLSRLAISVDGIGETHTRVRGFPYEALMRNLRRLKAMRDERGSALQLEVAMVVFDETKEDVDRYRRELAEVADRVEFNPRFVSEQRTQSCRELWRGAMVVLWDGRVSVCCADYDGRAIIGDAKRQPLAKIWNGEPMREMRRMHRRKRFPVPCDTCGEYEHAGVSKRFT